jgi:hypothetical protein
MVWKRALKVCMTRVILQCSMLLITRLSQIWIIYTAASDHENGCSHRNYTWANQRKNTGSGSGSRPAVTLPYPTSENLYTSTQHHLTLPLHTSIPHYLTLPVHTSIPHYLTLPVHTYIPHYLTLPLYTSTPLIAQDLPYFNKIDKIWTRNSKADR